MTAWADPWLEGRVVLVSGGTQGIGAAVARACVEAGADVVVTGRGRAAGAELVASLHRLGSRALFVPCDVADLDALAAVLPAAVDAFGEVHGLVNAAGLTSRGSLLDTSPALFAEHVAVNLRAPFFLMQDFVRHRLDAGGGGAVVNVISTAQHGGEPYLAPYAATKAGLAALTRNAAHAHRRDRVRVNGVNIGWTATPGEDAVQRGHHGRPQGWVETEGAKQPFGRLAVPEDVAPLAVLLLSDRAGVATGSVIDWDQHVVGLCDPPPGEAPTRV